MQEGGEEGEGDDEQVAGQEEERGCEQGGQDEQGHLGDRGGEEEVDGADMPGQDVEEHPEEIREGEFLKHLFWGLA